MIQFLKYLWRKPEKKEVAVPWEEFKKTLDTFEENKALLVTEIVTEDKKPLQPNYSIKQYNDVRLSRLMTLGANPNFLANFEDFSKREMGKVWIYSVNTVEFSIHTATGVIKFPGRGKKRYAVVTSLPQVVRYSVEDTNTDTLHAVCTDGRRVAMDIINPDNLGLDQSPKKASYETGSENRDLGDKGIFWSTNNPPLEKELRAARERMKVRYKVLLERAGVASRVTPKAMFDRKIACLVKDSRYTLKKATQIVYQEVLNITPELHAAMDYYNLTSEWHPFKGFVTEL